jgi:hypothetical protein
VFPLWGGLKKRTFSLVPDFERIARRSMNAVKINLGFTV